MKVLVTGASGFLGQAIFRQNAFIPINQVFQLIQKADELKIKFLNNTINIYKMMGYTD